MYSSIRKCNGVKGLAIAVIELAVNDYRAGEKSNPENYKSAKAFLESNNLDFWCEILDIEPDKIRRMLR